MNQVVIEFGSNINPEDNIEKAKELIRNNYNVIRESQNLITKPVGFKEQPDYINCAVLIETEIGLEEFKKELEDLEKIIGRVKGSNKFGPRIIDLDIVIWNKNIIHKDYYERDYIQKNVKEILPELGLS
jgi:2-amino-4-hydroxy-6-hydroxymethyldihydropteridine diphosphokinase